MTVQECKLALLPVAPGTARAMKHYCHALLARPRNYLKRGTHYNNNNHSFKGRKHSNLQWVQFGPSKFNVPSVSLYFSLSPTHPPLSLPLSICLSLPLPTVQGRDVDLNTSDMIVLLLLLTLLCHNFSPAPSLP